MKQLQQKLQDHLLKNGHSDWIAANDILLGNISDFIADTLTEYTDFLLKNGYCDTDVYAEPPTAIDRFLNPELFKN